MGSSFPAHNLPLYLPSTGGEGKLLNLWGLEEVVATWLYFVSAPYQKLIRTKQNKTKTKTKKKKHIQTKT